MFLEQWSIYPLFIEQTCYIPHTPSFFSYISCNSSSSAIFFAKARLLPLLFQNWKFFDVFFRYSAREPMSFFLSIKPFLFLAFFTKNGNFGGAKRLLLPFLPLLQLFLSHVILVVVSSLSPLHLYQRSSSVLIQPLLLASRLLLLVTN